MSLKGSGSKSVRRDVGEAGLDLVEPIQEETDVSHRRSAGR